MSRFPGFSGICDSPFQQNRIALRRVCESFPFLTPEIIQNLLMPLSLVRLSGINTAQLFCFPLHKSTYHSFIYDGSYHRTML
jgi:hypothetical protein